MSTLGWLAFTIVAIALIPYIGESWWTWSALLVGVVLAMVAGYHRKI